MVVPIRELANNTFSNLTNISFYISVAPKHSNINMENNINIGPLRERLPMPSNNNSRNSSIISKTLLVLYYEYMKIQNNNPLQYDLVEDEYISCSSNANIRETNISNSSVFGNNPKGKQYEINETPALNNTLPPYEADMANSQHGQNTQQEYFEVLINYKINSFTEPNAWNSKAYPISIFRHIKFLEINSKNMFTFLLHMANFIKTRKFEKYKTTNITELQGFGKVV